MRLPVTEEEDVEEEDAEEEEEGEEEEDGRRDAAAAAAAAVGAAEKDLPAMPPAPMLLPAPLNRSLMTYESLSAMVNVALLRRRDVGVAEAAAVAASVDDSLAGDE